MPRPLSELTLTDDERKTLEAWTRRPKTSQRLALRASIVLHAAAGDTNAEIAEELKIARLTVGKWRSRFVAKRIEGLNDEPRPGPPRTISDTKVHEVVTKTLESKPEHATHWSTRSMAATVGLTQNAVLRIWQAFGLKPHLHETFKLSTDPYFVDKVRDIVGLYLSPPEKALVFSLDEKSQIQALNRTQPILPMSPYHAERGTHDYERHGTTSLFAALNVATGEVFGQCYARHRQQEFVKFLKLLDAKVPEEEGVTIHLILDNYATHKTPTVKRWLKKHPRFVLHFTPTSSSWINQIERFFAAITEQRIRRGAFLSVKSLEKAILEYIDHHNQNPKPFVWTADPDLILERVENVCNRINQSGH